MAINPVGQNANIFLYAHLPLTSAEQNKKKNIENRSKHTRKIVHQVWVL
jgi:hypothetical protein